MRVEKSGVPEMPRVVPTQAVATIRRLFPGISRHNNPQPTYSLGNANSLRGIVDLVKEVPPEMIVLPEDVYANMVLATGAIENQLDIWISRGGGIGDVLYPINGLDPVLLICEALSQCLDEYPPPPSTSELTFVTDAALRDSIRRDIGAADRLLSALEWKAATVLAAAAIEALLHWRLDQAPPSHAVIRRSVAALQRQEIFKSRPPTNRDNWTLHQFIEVSADLGIIGANTAIEARLAKDFRNLIHPGKAARTGEVCDRGTALSARAALYHVVRDLDHPL
jgi:hypothetical protein